MQKRPSFNALLFGALLLMALFGATSCEKKQDKAWQYFGEASAEPAPAAEAAKPTP